jgi:membrane associated rhomboid family serine protease
VSTSGGGTLNAVLYVTMLACAIRAAVVVLGAELGRLVRRPPAPAVALWLVVAVPSLLQAPFPGVLRSLERDPDLIRGHGQWWRLFTAVLVQDGGAAGTVFNLVVLALIGIVAVRVWGGTRALIIFGVAAVTFNIGATFVSPFAGAGNSASTFALATSVTGVAMVTRPQRVTALLAAITAGCGIALLALLDAHGEAVLGGLVMGVLISAISPPDGRISGRGDADRYVEAPGE